MLSATLDRPVPTSTPETQHTHTPHASASGTERRDNQNIDFSAPLTTKGPKFEHQQALSQTPTGQAGKPDAGSLESLMKGIMSLFEKFFGAWFGGNAPAKPGPKPQPCDCPPARPGPPESSKPDPHYSKQNNEQLAQQLLDNFDAFKDPKTPQYITKQGLEAMASRPLSGDREADRNILLAKEMLRRPELVDALDRQDNTGALDGLINRQSIEKTLKSESPFKYKDDKQLAAEMLKHFDQLKGGFWSQTINTDDLEDLAEQKLTGDSVQDNLIWLAREIIQRSDSLKKMDNTGSSNGDGLISKKGLRKLSR